MNTDLFWKNVRIILMASGAYLAGRGIVPAEKVVSYVDTALNVLPALWGIGGFAWANYVSWKTKLVPENVAARRDVPTVSAATGKVEH